MQYVNCCVFITKTHAATFNDISGHMSDDLWKYTYQPLAFTTSATEALDGQGDVFSSFRRYSWGAPFKWFRLTIWKFCLYWGLMALDLLNKKAAQNFFRANRLAPNDASIRLVYASKVRSVKIYSSHQGCNASLYFKFSSYLVRDKYYYIDNKHRK